MWHDGTFWGGVWWLRRSVGVGGCFQRCASRWGVVRREVVFCVTIGGSSLRSEGVDVVGCVSWGESRSGWVGRSELVFSIDIRIESMVCWRRKVYRKE